MHSINRSVFNLALAGVLGSVSAAALAEPASDFENHDSKLTRGEFIKSAAAGYRAQGRQPVDDAVVTAKVKALLLQDESVKGLEVDVETHNGTVILSGLVQNPAYITQAEKIARNVEGVKDVKNELKIKG